MICTWTIEFRFSASWKAENNYSVVEGEASAYYVRRTQLVNR